MRAGMVIGRYYGDNGPLSSWRDSILQSGTSLNRSLSLPLLVFYGLGTILGAGIYVLIGEVVASAGMAAPLAFGLAALLVSFSALSYAELASRYPLSAGEALYVQHGFGRRWLSRLVGLLVVLIGIVSSATLARGIVGYLHEFITLPAGLVIALVVVGLGAVAAWGIRESVWLATLTTLVELAGLLLIIWVGRDALGTLPERWPEMWPALDRGLWVGVLGGAFLAFYAFIGFEDMVNVVEEVREPQQTMWRAIVIVLVVTTALYMLVALTAVLVLAPTQLGGSEAPLARVYEAASGRSAWFISLVGVSAVLNGALIQTIMASRVLYGMARQGWLPASLTRLGLRTRTPLLATALITLAILLFALWLPLVRLAEITSLITLLVFATVNAALLRDRLARGAVAEGELRFPLWVPLCGALSSAGFALWQLSYWLFG